MIAGETFNVVSDNGETLTLLTATNLGKNYEQVTTANNVTFSDSRGWENTPGPKEIDIQIYGGNVKTYVNEYVAYLQEETRDTTITGSLITLSQLKELGCTINEDYSYSEGLTCANSENAEWLINGQYWWTRSADSDKFFNVWVVGRSGDLLNYHYSNITGTRPLITISKDTLINLQ